jgi:hypothetical protein
MNTTNPELEAAVKRLRLADDALRFLSEIQKETMEELTEAKRSLEARRRIIQVAGEEAREALLEAKRALEAVQAPRRIMQVTGLAEGDILALTTDGEVWRLHFFKDLHVWDQVDPLPGSPVTATRAEEDL